MVSGANVFGLILWHSVYALLIACGPRVLCAVTISHFSSTDIFIRETGIAGLLRVIFSPAMHVDILDVNQKIMAECVFSAHVPNGILIRYG